MSARDTEIDRIVNDERTINDPDFTMWVITWLVKDHSVEHLRQCLKDAWKRDQALYTSDKYRDILLEDS